MNDIQTISDLVDRVRHTILSAPDQYSKYTDMNLEKSFLSMFDGIDKLKPQLDCDYDAFKQHLNSSLSAYKNEDFKTAISDLQAINNKLSYGER